MVLSENEIFGNLGVAVAALLTNYLIDTVGWRSAYFVLGAFSVLIVQANLANRRQQNLLSIKRC